MHYMYVHIYHIKIIYIHVSQLALSFGEWGWWSPCKIIHRQVFWLIIDNNWIWIMMENSFVTTVLSLLEAPGAKTLPGALLFHAIFASWGPRRDAYILLMTHDNFCKHTPVKQVVVAAIVILNNICRAWTIYLCMDSAKFLLEAPGASILWGRYYFVTTCRPIWGRFY